MKNYRKVESCRKVSRFADSMKTKCLVALLVLPLSLAAFDADAAHITFSPNGATVSATPGEMVSIPLAVTLSGASIPNAYASFSLTQVDGDLNRGWVNSQAYLSLNSWYKTRQTLLRINVPAAAARGIYTGVFSTMGLRSNEPVEPVSFVLNVEVSGSLACSQSPEFSEIISSEDAIHSRNHKLVTVDLRGVVTAAEGCSIDNAWYQLNDEYGELDKTESIEINDDGTFNVSVPMIASRKGDDKDGRLYTVIFTAENEAGLSESAETRFVVSHDNGNKDNKDKKDKK